MQNNSSIEQLVSDYKIKSSNSVLYLTIFFVVVAIITFSTYYYTTHKDTPPPAKISTQSTNTSTEISKDNPMFDTEVVNTDYVTFSFAKPNNYGLKIVDYNAELKTATNSPILKSFFLTSNVSCGSNSNNSTCAQNSFEFRLLKVSSLQIGVGEEVDMQKVIRSLTGLADKEEIQTDVQEKNTLYYTNTGQYFLLSPDKQYILQFLLTDKLYYVGIIGTVVFK